MFYISNLLTYKHWNDIFEDSSCEHKVNHAVVAIGYGTEKEKRYSIIRNEWLGNKMFYNHFLINFFSWDKKWGENGYFRITREKPNDCGVTSQMYYLIIERSKDTADMSNQLERIKNE